MNPWVVLFRPIGLDFGRVVMRKNVVCILCLGALAPTLLACTRIIVGVEPTSSPAGDEAESATSTPGATLPATEEESLTSSQPLQAPSPAPTSPPIPHLEAGSPISLGELHLLDPMTGWATGGPSANADHVLKTYDGGNSWIDVTPPEPAPSAGEPGKEVHAFFLDADHAWVIYGSDELVMSPTIWRTSDGGTSWQASQPLSLPDAPQALPLAMQFLDPQSGRLLVYREAAMGQQVVDLFSTADGGDNWERVVYPEDPSGHLILCNGELGLTFADPQYGWLLDNCDNLGRPDLLRTDDGGLSWEYTGYPPPSDEPDWFESRLCTSPAPTTFEPDSVLFALSCKGPSGDQTAFLYRTDDGKNWRTSPFPGGSPLFLTPETGFALGREVYKTTDGGASWTKVKTVAWEGQFSFFDDQHGWAVARTEGAVALVKTDDGGRTWQELQPTIAQPVTIDSIHMIDAATGWAFGHPDGEDERLLRTSNGGNTWLDITAPISALGQNQPQKLVDGVFLSAERAWIVSRYAPGDRLPMWSIWYTLDGGRSWAMGTAPDLGGNVVEFLTAPDSKDGWLMFGLDAGAGHSWASLFSTHDGGTHWDRILDPGDPDYYKRNGDVDYCCKSDLAFADGQTGLLTFSTGAYQQPFVDWSRDGGRSWQRQELPPPSANPDLFDFQNNTVFCGTYSPRLFSARSAYLVMGCYDLDSTDPGTSHAFFLYTTMDSGQTWTSRLLPDPEPSAPTFDSFTRSAGIYFLNPKLGWTVFDDDFRLQDGSAVSGTHLFQTLDGGESWDQVKLMAWKGQFSFVSESLGWAVARADGAVALVKTDDGGRNWRELHPVIRP